jgi:hypothetical protein
MAADWRICGQLHEAGCTRWDLREVAFRPQWVGPVIREAESIAVMADRFNAVPGRKMIQFWR